MIMSTKISQIHWRWLWQKLNDVPNVKRFLASFLLIASSNVVNFMISDDVSKIILYIF